MAAAAPDTIAARIARATLVAGMLDILAASILTLLYGRHVPDMLRSVASGPFPAARDWGSGGALLGLATHFALMAGMAATYVAVADRRPGLHARPLLSGLFYGLITFVIMNLVVVPLRLGPMPGARAIATQLFCHIVLVGWPIAFLAQPRAVANATQ